MTASRQEFVQVQVPATICVNCKHLKSISDGPRTGIWYNMYCSAVRRMSAIDPVSGNRCFLGKNSFGEDYFTDEEYPHCRDINKGNCPYFEEK